MSHDVYHAGMRELQDLRDTRRIADRLSEVTLRERFTDEDVDGNGMYRSWGNGRVNPHVALLFIDFETPKRLRVNGSAEITQDAATLAAHPGAVFVARIRAGRIFPNCPRYIHRMRLEEESVYVPRPGAEPPVPAWKTFEVFRDALPERDR